MHWTGRSGSAIFKTIAATPDDGIPDKKKMEVKHT